MTDPASMATFDHATLKLLFNSMIRDPALNKVLVLDRVKTCCKLACFYTFCQRPMDDLNLFSNSRLDLFKVHWTAIERLMEEDDKPPPKMSKSLKGPKFVERFTEYCKGIRGESGTPLYYLARPIVTPPPTAPNLLAGLLWSEEHGTFDGELIARFPMDHATASVDKAKLYDLLVAATKGHTSHAALTAHRDTRDGQAALKALIQMESGEAAWKKIAKDAHTNLMNHKWTTKGTITLSAYIASRRYWKQQMQAAEKHTSIMAIPDDEQMVDLLITNMTVDDQRLNAEIASIQGNDNAAGPKFDYEKTAEKLIPLDPVATKASKNTKRKIDDISADISALTDQSSGRDDKDKNKKSDEMKFYPPKQYRKLPKWMKTKLRDWQQTPEGKRLFTAQKAAHTAASEKSTLQNTPKSQRALIKSVVTEVQKEEAAEKDKQDEIHSIISSALASAATAAGKPTNSVQFATAASVISTKLNAIRSTVKNGKSK